MKLFKTLAAVAALCAFGAAAPAWSQSKTIYIGMNGGPMEKAYTSGVLPDFECTAPVDGDSATIINFIGGTVGLHAGRENDCASHRPVGCKRGRC